MYFILYVDRSNQWRWTFRAANHEAICVSSESYVAKQDALYSISLVKSGAAVARTFDDSTKNWI